MAGSLFCFAGICVDVVPCLHPWKWPAFSKPHGDSIPRTMLIMDCRSGVHGNFCAWVAVTPDVCGSRGRWSRARSLVQRLLPFGIGLGATIIQTTQLRIQSALGNFPESLSDRHSSETTLKRILHGPSHHGHIEDVVKTQLTNLRSAGCPNCRCATSTTTLRPPSAKEHRVLRAKKGSRMFCSALSTLGHCNAHLFGHTWRNVYKQLWRRRGCGIT